MADIPEPDKDQIDEQALATKQALKYAEDLAQTYGALRESEKRYRALFEYAPISLWEVDWSRVKKYIDGLRYKGVSDFREHFDNYPEELQNCADLIRFIDVNRSSLELYAAESKDDLLSYVQQTIKKLAQENLKEDLIILCEGRTFKREAIHRTLKGKKITVLIKAIIPPGCEESWSRVLFSIYDLTERVRSDFLKKMFGRYLSEPVMNTLIENPESVKLGGEKRTVTILMTDLRGFTTLAERLDPEQVVRILNNYFEVMVEVIHQYNGTLNEIAGDSMLIIFGAPQLMPNQTQHAIACAIEMQNAMAKVNGNSRAMGLPEIEMGIGINEDEVIVGNIGSKKRSKYGVVGSGVNMTSRIEACSVGGQILVSESVYQKAGEILRVDNQMKIRVKGAEGSLTLFEVGGISGDYNLSLRKEKIDLLKLIRAIPVQCNVLDGKYVGEDELKGEFLRLSPNSAEIRLGAPLEPLTNIRLNLSEVSGGLSAKDFFGKIIRTSDREKADHIIRFTAVPPEVSAYFQALCRYAAEQKKSSPDS